VIAFLAASSTSRNVKENPFTTA